MFSASSGKRRSVRLGFAAALVALTAVITTGCIGSSSPSGGQTLSQAEAALAGTPGVSRAVITDENAYYSGLTPHYVLMLKIELAPGYTIGTDEAATLDWLYRTLWSIRDVHEGWTVHVRIRTVGGERSHQLGRDLRAAEELIGVGAATEFTGESSSAVLRNTGHKVFGSWPGEVPDAPAGAFVYDPEALAADQAVAAEYVK